MDIGEKLGSLSIAQEEEANVRSRNIPLTGWFICILISLILFIGYIYYQRSVNLAPVDATYDLELVEPAQESSARSTDLSIESGITASGYVVSLLEATVASDVTGRVLEVLVEAGQFIEEGQLTAILDDRLPKADLEILLLQRRQLATSLDLLKIELEEARRVLEREQEMVAKGFGSGASLTSLQTQVEILGFRVSGKVVEIETTESQINKVRIRLTSYQVLAPFSGIVTARNAQAGEMISPISAGGGFTRTGIYTLVDMSQLAIEVDINESFMSTIQEGNLADVVFDAYPDSSFPAAVSTILPVVSRERASIRTQLQLIGDNKPQVLPGMAVTVTFQN